MASHSLSRLRRIIAQEAARIMEEEGVADYYAAKRKAATRIGATDNHNLPRNCEIEQARQELHRIFYSESLPERLFSLRTAAAQAMRLFEDFQPRLVGAVLSGIVSAHTAIELHLFSATPEEVKIFLDERQIPYHQAERRFRFSRDNYQNMPIYEFCAGNWNIVLATFPLSGIRCPPLNSLSGRPERRINLSALYELLNSSGSDSSKLANNAHNSSSASIHANGRH